jgi:hypothetical protein
MNYFELPSLLALSLSSLIWPIFEDGPRKLKVFLISNFNIAAAAGDNLNRCSLALYKGGIIGSAKTVFLGSRVCFFDQFELKYLRRLGQPQRITLPGLKDFASGIDYLNRIKCRQA